MYKKSLMYSDSEYKTFRSDVWVTVTANEPTFDDFLSDGIDDLSILPDSAWAQLSGIVELIYFTEEPNKTEACFNIETEHFYLIDEWDGKQIQVIEYTDNLLQEESVITLETEPFMFEEELSGSLDVLYYTDDTTATSATLEIVNNYSPLDELSDASLLMWTDEVGDINKHLKYDGVPKSALIIQTEDLVVFNTLLSAEISATLTGFSKGKLVFSGDGGATWNTLITHSDSTYMMKPLDALTLPNVKRYGIDFTDLSLISATDWAAMTNIQKKYRFAYYLESYSQSDFAKINNLTFRERIVSKTPTVSNINIVYDEIDAKYSGLMFMDTSQQYYSTSIGEILKYLDFGTLIAGQTSLDVKVILTNTYPFDVENIRLSVDNGNSGVNVQLSKTNTPFIPMNNLIFDQQLLFDETLDFYVRLDIDDTAAGESTFDIKVDADPI